MANGEIRAKIRKEDIKALRSQIQVGDVVVAELRHDELGERLIVPTRVEQRVRAKYPNLVELDSGIGKRRTATYVDILLGQLEGGRGNICTNSDKKYRIGTGR